MSYEELREIGKIWILTGVFSTCFFASCGQNPTSPPESVTPVVHTAPVPQAPESAIVDRNAEFESHEVDSGYSEELEGSGFGSSDRNAPDREFAEQLEDYPEDIPEPL